jgi:hypothetical protein
MAKKITNASHMENPGGAELETVDERLAVPSSGAESHLEGQPEGVAAPVAESVEEAPEAVGVSLKFPALAKPGLKAALALPGEELATHEPLGVHQARVDSTAFLDRQTGDDFGMGQDLDMAAFSAPDRRGVVRAQAPRTAGRDGLADDPRRRPVRRFRRSNPNLPPVIDINTTLLVDDDATENPGHLRATDRESGPSDLKYMISQGPVHGVLMIDGKEVDAAKVTFTQADLDSGRVTFRFDPHAQDKVLVIEGDTFVFTVTDGTDTTGPATFHIQNTTVQVWGTDGDDDLTNVADFDRDGSKVPRLRFRRQRHPARRVGRDTLLGGAGNDTLRGGAGADSLNGGAGIRDLADYSTSDVAVNVDLTRTGAQSGGHAEGDTLVGIEDVLGSRFNDVITGDGNSSNRLWGGDGDDTIFGGSGYDTIMGAPATTGSTAAPTRIYSTVATATTLSSAAPATTPSTAAPATIPCTAARATIRTCLSAARATTPWKVAAAGAMTSLWAAWAPTASSATESVPWPAMS